MKKLISVLLLIVLTLSLSACNKSNNTSSQLVAGSQSDSTPSTNTTPSNTTPSNNTPSNSTPSKTEEPKPTVVAGEYTVIFDYGYDNKKITAKSQSYKVVKPEEPIRSGYKFMGWYAANESEQWNFTGHAVTTDMTLTAKWMKYIYDISYSTVVNGENTNILKEKIGDLHASQPSSGEPVPKFEKGVRAGFEGYSVAIFDGTEEKKGVPNIVYDTSEYDFYFFRVPSTFSVDTETFTIPELKFDGLEFLGWTYDGQSTPVKTVTVSKGTTKDYKLVANWKSK